MLQENGFIYVIPPEKDAEIRRQIIALNEAMAPHLRSLKAAERKGKFKLGDKSISFLLKNLAYASQNGDLVPQFMSVDRFAQVATGNDQLVTYRRLLSPTITAMDDTIMLSGAEALESAMMFYHHVKLLSTNGVTKARAIYDDLAARFPGRRKKRVQGEPAN